MNEMIITNLGRDMAFTTSCFVLVKDKDKRKELIEWLKGVGYDTCVCCGFPFNEYLHCTTIKRQGKQIAEVHGVYNAPDSEMPNFDAVGAFLHDTDDVDCGDNIDLFRVLAYMRDDTDMCQFFFSEQNIKDETITFCTKDKMTDNLTNHYHKATAEELVEYFSERE